MLEKIDLTRKLDKDEYKRIAPSLRERLGELQRSAHAAGMPVIIIFEGWEASGKGTLINELILPLDPRGFRVHYIHAGTDDNQNAYWPPMRRFWQITPPRGRIGIFNRSWYRLVMDSPESLASCMDISSFERQLSQDGYIIMKFFLHIGKKEQKKRLRRLDRDASSAWRVSEREWQDNEKYNDTVKLVDEIIQYTDKSYAPWTLVEAHDKRYATVKILNTVVKSLEKGLELREAKKRGSGIAGASLQIEENVEGGADDLASFALEPSVLKNLDLGKSMEEEEYEERLPKLQERLRVLQYELYKARRPMVIAFEGKDAAGKGGCIKRLTQRLDPRGYQVSPTAAPNDWERAHHYLWRFWEAFPKAGHIGIYDRSWYGRVLVERVEGFADEQEWRRAYGEINEMEDQWYRYGAIIVKFWLQIDNAEQLARFNERNENPEKNWKITDEDWRNREKWPKYEEAAEEMMLRTSTSFAPWIIVEANDKLYARVKVLKKAIEAAEARLGKKK
ncbi:MAG: polyphosphate:AMP phosphotransferase [Synergistaceae bacterium]|jgi:polyphosphate:AMP phosphotransferase|nr:polyphosphate:AMP phosphotransferase [Synergistaceae bacterium]